MMHPSTISYICAMATPPCPACVRHIDKAVVELTASGLWGKLDFFYPGALHSEQAARINMVQPSMWPLSGAMLWAPQQGLRAIGGLNTGCNPTAALTRMTQMSAHTGAYVLNEAAGSSEYVFGGAGVNAMRWIVRTSAGEVAARVCNNNASPLIVPTPTSVGHVLANRLAGDRMQVAREGAIIGSVATPADATPSEIHLLRYGGAYSTARLACAHGGAGLTEAEMRRMSFIVGALTAGLTACGQDAKPFDVFLLAGQSNHMRGATKDAAIDVPHPLVFQYGRGAEDGLIIPASEPLQHHDPTADKIGFALAMMRDHYAHAGGRHVLLVPCAQGGTGFSTNHWRPGDPLFNDAVFRANAAMTTHPNNRFRGVLWSQGETDALAGMPLTAYAAHLDAVIDAMRADIAGAVDAPFVVGGMPLDWVGTDAARLAIQAALVDTPNRRSRCAYVDPTGLPANPSDPVHFSAPAQRLRAQRFHAAWASIAT